MHNRKPETGLIRNFYLTELFANVLGAPLATIYGGSLIDFSMVPFKQFILNLVVIIICNQLFLALPVNIFIGTKTRNYLSHNAADSAERQYLFFSRLPLIQAGLVFLRMLLCAVSAVLLVGRYFGNPTHVLATIIFGLYASFITGLVIYYFLQAQTTQLLESLVLRYRKESGSIFTPFSRKLHTRLQTVLGILPLMSPIIITTIGIILLIVVMRQSPDQTTFFTSRIIIALSLNLLTVPAIQIYGRYISKKRLLAIRIALKNMVELGDTARIIPTDLRDDNSLTAAWINEAFDLFRLLLEKLKTTTDSLSETVVKFSTQNRETVAATTQQASAVKEIVSTMQDSSQISRQIQEQAVTLAQNSDESQSYVDNGFGKVQDTIQKMSEIREANQLTLQEISDLSEEVSSIGEIIDIITGIANQTRIIAFNAELEASSAGSAGASFRIVAEEIRRLANGTVEALAGIKNRIQQIELCSQHLQTSSEEGTLKIGEGMDISRVLNTIFMQIRSAADNTTSNAKTISSILITQNQAFEQIFQTLKQISEGAEQILAGTRESSMETSRVQSLIDELKSLLQRFSPETLQAETRGLQ